MPTPIHPLRQLKRGVQGFLFRLGDRLRAAGIPFQLTDAGLTFQQYKHTRTTLYSNDLSALRVPCRNNLVSIVLPVYNGERYLPQAIDSVLAQSYREFELLIVDDGSNDRSPEILKSYADRDSRIRILRQDNQKLPRALSNGFRVAEGEYLTWISDDNRMHPSFLETLVEDLKHYPDRDMIYANMILIGDDGVPMAHSERYPLYQKPYGSPYIHLPHDLSELNAGVENYIGAAFLYRARVPFLLGDYSSQRFGLEDYDYWMRVNELMTLRHAGFDECLYEYRYHDTSLTSRARELAIEEKKVQTAAFDVFRRHFCLQPLDWMIDDKPAGAASITTSLRQQITDVGHRILSSLKSPDPLEPSPVYLHITTDANPAIAPPGLPEHTTKVLVAVADVSLPAAMSDEWDLCVAFSPTTEPIRLPKARQGWLAVNDIETLFTAIDIRARSDRLAWIESHTEPPRATGRTT